MPLYPFHYDEEANKGSAVFVDLTEEEEENRRRDYEGACNGKEYRSRFEPDWRDGAMTYNVTQSEQTDDRVTNIFIGLGRMIIDQGIAMMTEGEPEFDFDPVGPSDQKKAILWKAAVKLILSQCNYKSHQDKFITDFHVFGPGVFEVYTQLPYRTLRYEDEAGNMESRLVRDFRRTKVGVRHVSPWDCWRNPNVSDPDEVPSCGREQILTRAQFVQNYANQYVVNQFGLKVPKYNQKHIKQLLAMAGSHFKVTKLENEITDVLRIYAIPFGTVEEGIAPQAPTDLGLPILDKALKIKTVKGTDGYRSQGANVLGQCTLCFGANNDMYDEDYKHHALYGMGIPRLIEGPDMGMQAFTNMQFDNMRLANTVPIGYKSFDGKSGLDLDVGQMYSGMLIDGEIVTSPLGQVNLSSYQYMNEWLNQTAIQLTGINFQQLVGDTSKTAFEFAQRIRQNNQRAERRLRSLENGCLKRMARLLIANVLSELTIEEWEEMSEDDVKRVAAEIERGAMTGDDIMEEDGKKKKRRVHMYIPVQGRKFREDFSQSKRRKLDYESTDNTLIEDPDMEGETSYVPMDRNYLMPAGDIESILSFDIRVDGKRMLGDLKAQDMEMMDKAMRLGMEVSQFSPELAKELDLKKQYIASVKIAGLEEEDVLKTQSRGSKILETMKNAVTELENLPQSPNALLSQVAPQPGSAAPGANPPEPQTPTGATAAPPANFSAVAAGTV